MTRKICVVITARASYSRIKTALKEIEKHPELELQLVVAASALLKRYGDAINFIEKDGFKVAARVYSVVEGESLITSAKSTGMGIIELATCFDNLQPDAVVTIADRYETLATAIAASYMNIPLVHIQGGEVTGSIDEKVRHAVTKLSDIHFVSTNAAAERVSKMGEAEDCIFNTGCPSIDLALSAIKSQTDDCKFNPFDKYGGVGVKFDLSDGYIVAMQHPVTTEHENAFEHVNATLNAVNELKIPTFWFWPNVDSGSDATSKGIRIFREHNPDAKIHFFRGLEPMDFIRLIDSSRAVIGNSSVGIRECNFLGIPVVNIGNRQAGRERGENVIDVNYEKNEILKALNTQIAHDKYNKNYLYGDGNAGRKIAELLASTRLSFKKKLIY
jgi:GDP/UDP-N,N'-diacetylbacillosamine 2-epimerase (hydrolysing)